MHFTKTVIIFLSLSFFFLALPIFFLGTARPRYRGFRGPDANMAFIFLKIELTIPANAVDFMIICIGLTTHSLSYFYP